TKVNIEQANKGREGPPPWFMQENLGICDSCDFTGATDFAFPIQFGYRICLLLYAIRACHVTIFGKKGVVDMHGMFFSKTCYSVLFAWVERVYFLFFRIFAIIGA
ncbi:hypothetical protein ACJX0J_020199, partial [Zea mays]